jgi:hypothetical protein
LNEVVENAQSHEVFSLDKLLSETAYPVEKVTVFTDAYSVNELIKLRAEREALELTSKRKRTERTVSGETGGATAEVEKLTERIAEFDDKIGDSGLTFTIQGMSPATVDEINDKYFVDKTKNYDNSPEERERDMELIARSILSVENANGVVDPDPITPEKVAILRGRLIGNEYGKLVRAVAQVNLNGALFDQATDATFHSRRSNVAG